MTKKKQRLPVSKGRIRRENAQFSGGGMVTLEKVLELFDAYADDSGLESWAITVIGEEGNKDGICASSVINYPRKAVVVVFNLNHPDHEDKDELLDTVAHEMEHCRLGGIRQVVTDILETYVPKTKFQAVLKQYEIMEELLVAELANLHLRLLLGDQEEDEGEGENEEKGE